MQYWGNYLLWFANVNESYVAELQVSPELITVLPLLYYSYFVKIIYLSLLYGSHSTTVNALHLLITLLLIL